MSSKVEVWYWQYTHGCVGKIGTLLVLAHSDVATLKLGPAIIYTLQFDKRTSTKRVFWVWLLVKVCFVLP
jgi:hypothetical protein